MKRKKRMVLLILTIFMAGYICLPAYAGEWKKDSLGWWYENEDQSYLSNTWSQIDNKWYYFDRNGYMCVGWKMVDRQWYYFYQNGVMAQNAWIGNYYLGENGAMLTSSITPDGYYVDANGCWITEKKSYCHNVYDTELGKDIYITILNIERLTDYDEMTLCLRSSDYLSVDGETYYIDQGMLKVYYGEIPQEEVVVRVKKDAIVQGIEGYENLPETSGILVNVIHDEEGYVIGYEKRFAG